jgi:hypothetical protein
MVGNSAYAGMPPSVNRLGWPLLIYPYIEQTALYQQAAPHMNGTDPDYRPTSSPGVWPGAGLRVPILNCPTDPNGEKSTGLNSSNVSSPRNFVNYLGCLGSTGILINGTDRTATKLDGMFFAMSKVGMRDLTDGTTNTVMVGEIRLLPDDASLPGDDGADWRGHTWNAYGGGAWFSTRNPPNTRVADAHIRCRQDNPQVPCVRVSSSSNVYLHARSAHVGGAQFATADGSGHFISENIDGDLFRALGSRNGGEVIGEF